MRNGDVFLMVGLLSQPVSARNPGDVIIVYSAVVGVVRVAICPQLCIVLAAIVQTYLNDVVDDDDAVLKALVTTVTSSVTR